MVSANLTFPRRDGRLDFGTGTETHPVQRTRGPSLSLGDENGIHCHPRAGHTPPGLGAVATGSERSHAMLRREGSLTSASWTKQRRRARSFTFRMAECSRVPPQHVDHVSSKGRLAGHRNYRAGSSRRPGRGKLSMVWLGPHAKNPQFAP